MNSKKTSKFSIFFILAIFTLISESGLAFQVTGGTSTSRYQNSKSFLTGKLNKLTASEIQTTVGRFTIDSTVTIIDSRKNNQESSQQSNVQLSFENNRLMKLTIY